ncbi:NADH dehydrogenase [ubiquinone] 1 alpha subcomplex subunit 7-like [Pollicipes pollicipes]|uniref:NADH dehydrogenase [ubiquinone] 1 alpha subcomplex subunit 7-like n=1 Tax=Pollicipes pollicipes TaxID=41117 RepID=UPI00188555C4|nr:NADH dehydrogenase [ubiquinone] 1 alpha subcomplex subunit 7-like [Pollicipes pollicipes]XP_037090472.1 NADH dehydrogenase [ubiquinone] 1 alpha subcomplex subunit 7-like [Pollicipes pollicipes]XP_037090473.1 NADH dehydrogenase [ubiquinone] 1 alpha subcomplex subunit 7-like [Pollicipes pollicipes]
MPPKPPVQPRDISPLLQMLRNALLGRQHTLAIRSPASQAVRPRSQPEPVLPEGSLHKLSANYYHTRDARRDQTPPLLLVENTGAALLAAKKSKKEKKAKKEKAAADAAVAAEETVAAEGTALAQSAVPRPGQPYVWDGRTGV